MYLGGAENIEENGKQLSQYRQDPVFCEIGLDELGKQLHRSVDGIGGKGREERDERVEEIRVFVWPVAIGY